MALTRTFMIGSGGFLDGGTGATTTNAFTPADNSLLVVLFTYLSTTNGNPEANAAVTDVGAGLTWTKRVSSGNVGGGVYTTQIWSAPVTTGTSMQVKLTGPDDGGGEAGVFVYDYTGYNPSSPFGATAGDIDAASKSLTLSGAPASDSDVIAALSDDCATSIDPGGSGGFSELNQIISGCIPFDISFQAQARTGSTGTTVDWTSDHNGTASAALEIKAGSAPSAPLNLTLSSAVGSNVALSWDTPSSGAAGIDNYSIYRGTPQTRHRSTRRSRTQRQATSTQTYTDTAAVGGMPFFYRVTATNAVGTSTYSNQVSGLGGTGRIIRLKGGLRLRGGVRLR
jgi:hypothetical protein